jgi:5-methylcytosine-specific restriction endonuclease McrA
MNKEELENYIKEHSTREAAEHFGCSQTSIQYWMRKLGIRKNKKKVYTEIGEKRCPKCGQVKPLIEFYKPNGRKNVSWCRICMTAQIVERQHECKKQAVIYKGGGCKVCGFNDYFGALEFHHLDPKEKDIGFSRMSRRFLTNDMIRELDKCILLCSNCHRMVHAGIIEINDQGNIIINKEMFDNIDQKTQ